MKYLQFALDLLDKGVVCVPFNADSKCLVKWQEYQTRIPSVEETTKMFSNSGVRFVALICRDGIEAVDIDSKHQEEGQDIFAEYVEHLKFHSDGERILKSLLVESTKSNGYHFIYRCSKVENNKKLAYNSSREVVLETRGNGGLLFIAPSEGYKVKRGDFLNIPEITEADRDLLMNVAKSFDRDPKKKNKQDVPEIEIIRKEYRSSSLGKSGLTSWDDYDSKDDVLGLLYNAGWVELASQSNRQWLYFNRPGAKNQSKIDGAWNRHSRYFYNFSGSDINFDGDAGYSPTSIFAILNYDGDYSSACKELYRLDYGDRVESPSVEQDFKLKAKDVQEKTNTYEFLKSTKFSRKDEVVESVACLTVEVNGKVFKVASFGMLGAVVGMKKAGKSLVTSAIAASGICGERKLNFKLDRMNRSMEFHDTEQSKEFYQQTQNRIFDIANAPDDVNYYDAYHSRRLDPDERLANIRTFIYENKTLGVLFIDGIVDLMMDYNDLTKSKAVINELMKWADELDILIITILHLTKTAGTMRGHLGTELENKCDFSIQIAMEEGEFTVTSRDSRYRPFPSFSFVRHERDGMPVLDGHRIDEQMGELNAEDLAMVANPQESYRTAENLNTIPASARGNGDIPF